ncbi:ubiquinol-cytochrome-c reductase complex assembly factor 1 [Ceratina calcarata]|uniref:Ubiquinol-cytochrome-c reductase complex assembly factor 1 n=1 Tax=Ceratina calcarata TaxID=156304 RepID=A0AAJ7J6C8_9HYME|nr:ubiquinol-cytochrome-c reductase complex assembly factor 1 [Ceratina calcarata]
MQCTRMLRLGKMIPLATVQHITGYNFSSINSIMKPRVRQFCKNVSIKNALKNVGQPRTQNTGMLQRVSHRFTLFKMKYQLIGLGYQLYDNIPDKLDYSIFFKDFAMNDTFFSWFKVTELHVWMLMVRFMAEGDKGKVVVQNIVESMWHDVIIRAEKLGPIPSKIRNKQIMELSHQFNAAIIDYDEGILSDDKTLASALWRTFFNLECNNPEQLEKLLIYVRKQISILDKIPSDKLYRTPVIKWLDLRTIETH